MAAVHLLIKGKVQGVFFRASAKKLADRSHIQGWIKNTKDGNVEIMITGDDKPVQEFIDWCKKGPPGAEVSDVVVHRKPETLQEGFSIIR